MARYKKYNNDYKTDELGFPSVFIPEDKKDADYHKEWAKAMYSQWQHDNAAIPYSYQTDIDVLRSYGKGAQSIEQYLKKDHRNATGGADASGTSKEFLRTGMGNIDLSIISVAPKVKSMIKAYLNNIREDIVVDTVDPTSGAKKDEAKWRLMFYSKNKSFVDSYRRKMGIETDEPEFLPNNLDELEMYEEAGGFKLAQSIYAETLVKHTHDISGYEHELEDELYNDLMDIGIAATKTYLDPEDSKFKDKYIDPKNLVVQNSMHNDFRSSDWRGHVATYTIGQLRVLMPDLSEDDFKQIAYSYKGMLKNPGDFKKYNVMNNHGSFGYDSFEVAVFEAEWLDQDEEEAVFYDSSNGRRVKLPVNEETTKGLGGRKRYVKSKLQRLRECSWVVGTEYQFDWGLVNMQDRPNGNKVVSNYHIRALSDAPLIAQMRPVLDDLQKSYIRWQDAMSNAVKSGYAINMSKLKAINDGTEDGMSLWEVLKLWKERGLLLYQDSFTGEYQGGKTLPIDQLPSTLIDEINEFATAWDHALKRMEDLTGINALVLGAAPDPDAPVTTQKLSVASSANAIKPLGVALNGIKRESSMSIVRRLTLAGKVRPDIMEAYSGVIGKKGVKTLTMASKSMVEYGMVFNVRPTETEKADILRATEQSMQNRREGRPGIDLQTAMTVRERLYAGANLKKLRLYIGYMEKKIAERDKKDKLEMINAQGQQNMAAQQQKSQSDLVQAQQKAQSEGMLQQQKSRGDLISKLVDKDDAVSDKVARTMGVKDGAIPAPGQAGF